MGEKGIDVLRRFFGRKPETVNSEVLKAEARKKLDLALGLFVIAPVQDVKAHYGANKKNLFDIGKQSAEPATILRVWYEDSSGGDKAAFFGISSDSQKNQYLWNVSENENYRRINLRTSEGELRLKPLFVEERKYREPVVLVDNFLENAGIRRSYDGGELVVKSVEVMFGGTTVKQKDKAEVKKVETETVFASGAIPNSTGTA